MPKAQDVCESYEGGPNNALLRPFSPYLRSGAFRGLCMNDWLRRATEAVIARFIGRLRNEMAGQPSPEAGVYDFHGTM